MEKKQLTAKQKTARSQTAEETLRRLADSKLQAIVGGARMHPPTGFADDTTPIYDDTRQVSPVSSG